MFFYPRMKMRLLPCCRATDSRNDPNPYRSVQPVKLTARLILNCVLASLLTACDSNQGTSQQANAPAATVEPAPLASTPDPDTETPFPAAGNHAIDLSPGRVSIRANQVNERELLNELATRANFQLLTANFDWQLVTVDIQVETLHAALVELLEGYPYQIVYAPDRDTQQEVLTEVVIGELPATETGDSMETQAGDTALLRDIEELSEDGRQMAYIQALQSPQTEVRAAAAKKIEPVGDGFYRLTDLLLKDPAPEVRIATTWALEHSDDPMAIEALVKCLQDENPDVIVECIKSLDFLGDETTVQYLIPMLTHSDGNVRTAAAEAIKSLQ
jgi:hypothetical protein